MSRRLKLHERLLGILPDAYFQPPGNVRMKYPCILYKRAGADAKRADDGIHRATQSYTVTVIDRDPESPASAKVAALPMCRYDRSYAADGLNHDVYTLYF